MPDDSVVPDDSVEAVLCSGCGTELTVPLRFGDPSGLVRDGGDEVPTVQSGVAIVDPEPRTVWGTTAGEPGHDIELCPAGSLVVNPEDLLPDAVVLTGQPGGCCGLDGMDGPNLGCAACGQTLGTAQTDCWTPAEVRFLPDSVCRRN